MKQKLLPIGLIGLMGLIGLIGLIGPIGPIGQMAEINYSLPQDLTFAGQKVPTEYWFVREGLTEWLLAMQSEPATTCKYVRRSLIYEQFIKEKLKAANLPEDLFYIAVIESGLNLVAKSKAGAVGLWQFMKSTGRIYDLRDNGVVDERKLVDKATDAAIEHFKDLYEEFHDWFLAGAAYNAGEGRVEKMIKKYSTKNYWLLKFPKQETQDYMYRAVVMKEVMENLEKYGFSRQPCTENFQPEVKVYKKRFFKTTSLIRFAKELGLEYLEFLKLNPAFIHRETVPAGSYLFLIPINLAAPTK